MLVRNSAITAGCVNGGWVDSHNGDWGTKGTRRIDGEYGGGEKGIAVCIEGLGGINFGGWG